jgi:hypothetical protein
VQLEMDTYNSTYCYSLMEKFSYGNVVNILYLCSAKILNAENLSCILVSR